MLICSLSKTKKICNTCMMQFIFIENEYSHSELGRSQCWKIFFTEISFHHGEENTNSVTKYICCMANLEVFVFVPDLLLSRRFAPGQKRKSGTKTKTSKFAMQQIYFVTELAFLSP